MPAKLLHFSGVYGEQRQPFWDMPLHVEALQKRSEVFDFEINEHLHADLVQLFLLEEGGGVLFSEGKTVLLEVPCVIIIPQGVLHGFLWETDIKGTVFTIALSFFEKCLAANQQAQVVFRDLQYLQYGQSDVAFTDLCDLRSRLRQEADQHLLDKGSAVASWLHLLLLSLYRQSQQEHTQIIPTNNRLLQYFNAFQKAVNVSFDQGKTVQQYAADLNITSVHLNRICQALVKRSALRLVHEKMAAEARKHLIHSTQTIAEIAYSLNFKDPSHFSRFFRKMEGMSPRTFRKERRDKSDLVRLPTTKSAET